jgi:hypothetical protein
LRRHWDPLTSIAASIIEIARTSVSSAELKMIQRALAEVRRIRTTPTVGRFPRSRLTEPDEIARAILLLASPTMPSLIATNLMLDGGSFKAV